MVLGVRRVVVKTAHGTTTTDYPVAPLAQNPGAATAPAVGTTLLDGEQAGTDTTTCAGYPDRCDRPMFPALFLTDITADPTRRAGDWQAGGTPFPPHAVFGTWKAAVRTVDATKSPALVTVTPDADPAKNDWHLGSGDPAPSGLKDEGYVASDRVNEIASFAAGLARPGRVLLHARATRGRLEWRRLIAHELTHVVQFNLAGGDGRADQWLAEGLAERVAFDVLERMGLDSLADRRGRALSGARKHPGFANGRLDLAALGSPREFTLRHQRDGSLETYQLSFLMADYLVKRDGLPVVLDYFRNCRVMDRDRAFARTFGQSTQQFETEVLAYLRGLSN